MTTKNSNQVKKVTGMDIIPYIAPGAATDAEGHIITEDGLTALVEASFEAEKIPAIQQQLTAAQAAQKKAEDGLVPANSTITELNARIKTLEDSAGKKVEDDDNAPAAEMVNTVRDNDKVNDKIPFHQSHKDPSNVIADSLFGEPIK